eukprot:snap_masked-scaffold_11-processed-gene-0.9-mRNA-1 protein AED:0.62 eAED:0.64 QI:0/0/0/0.5/1/1/4/0/338
MFSGTFFRQYLDPISREYLAKAREAVVSRAQVISSIEKKSKNTSVSSSFRSMIEAKFLEDSDLTEDMVDDRLTNNKLPLNVSSQTSITGVKSVGKRVKKKRLGPGLFLSETLKCICPVSLEEGVEHLRKDEKLKVILDQVGSPSNMIDRIGNLDPFLALLRSIVFQQLSVKAASSIFERFELLCGGKDSINPNLVLSLEKEKMRSVGFSYRKAEYAKSLALTFLDNKITKRKLEKLSDSEVRNILIKVKGLGDWSIHMFLMFSLGRLDVFPVGDLVVRKACKRLFNLTGADQAHDTKVDTLPDAHQLHPLAESWRPYRSIATWILWHAMESEVCSYAY